jgi:hypothetical protein
VPYFIGFLPISLPFHLHANRCNPSQEVASVAGRRFDVRMADNRTISQLEAEGYHWIGCECCKGTVWVPFKMLRDRIPMLSAMTRPARRQDEMRQMRQASGAILSCKPERHARVCSNLLDAMVPRVRRANRSGPRAVYFLDVASFSRTLSAFLSAVILASSVAVSCSWSINSSSRDIESSSLCFMTISNFGLRYHK